MVLCLDKVAVMINFEKIPRLRIGDLIMTLVKWDPFRDVERLQNRINRIFEDSFGRSRDLDQKEIGVQR